MDADLRSNPYAATAGADPRLVSPVLEQVFLDKVRVATAEGREAGYADGYAEGMSQARRDAQTAARAAAAAASVALRAQKTALDGAVAALTDAIQQLEAMAAAEFLPVEREIVEAAYRLAEALIGRELAVAVSPVRDAVVRAFRLAPEGEAVVLRLSPSEADAVTDVVALAGGRRVTVVPDHSVAPGGCVMDAGSARIDARLEASLARVREVLNS